MNWVKCSDLMPKESQIVLATNSHIHASEVCIYTKGVASGRFYFGASSGKFIATHWMPLPEPPDE